MQATAWERMNKPKHKVDCSQTSGAEAGPAKAGLEGANKHACLSAHFKTQQGVLHRRVYDQEAPSKTQ